jgi:hypothetical protein
MFKINTLTTLVCISLSLSVLAVPRTARKSIVEMKAKGLERVVLQNKVRRLETLDRLTKEEKEQLDNLKKRLGNTTGDIALDARLTVQLDNTKNSILRKGGSSKGFEQYLNRIIIESASTKESLSVYKILEYIRKNGARSNRGEAVTSMIANLMELYKHGGEMIAFSTQELHKDVISNKTWKAPKINKFNDILAEASYIQKQNIKLTPHEAFIKALENDPGNSFKKKIRDVLEKVCKG